MKQKNIEFPKTFTSIFRSRPTNIVMKNQVSDIVFRKDASEIENELVFASPVSLKKEINIPSSAFKISNLDLQKLNEQQQNNEHLIYNQVALASEKTSPYTQIIQPSPTSNLTNPGEAQLPSLNYEKKEHITEIKYNKLSTTDISNSNISSPIALVKEINNTSQNETSQISITAINQIMTPSKSASITIDPIPVSMTIPVQPTIPILENRNQEIEQKLISNAPQQIQINTIDHAHLTKLSESANKIREEIAIKMLPDTHLQPESLLSTIEETPVILNLENYSLKRIKQSN